MYITYHSAKGGTIKPLPSEQTKQNSKDSQEKPYSEQLIRKVRKDLQDLRYNTPEGYWITPPGYYYDDEPPLD